MAEKEVSYGQNHLLTLKAEGFVWIEFWCVARARTEGRDRCFAWTAMRIEEAIERFGPGASLVMLARRARCRICGQTGCHVQAARIQGGGWNGPRR